MEKLFTMITISTSAIIQKENRRNDLANTLLIYLCSLISMTSHGTDFFCAGKSSLQVADLYSPGVLTTEDILMGW